MVTINQLVDIVEDIAGVKLKRHYNLTAPKGVNGRNSDNTLILKRARLGAAACPLRDGMEKTYRVDLRRGQEWPLEGLLR